MQVNYYTLFLKHNYNLKIVDVQFFCQIDLNPLGLKKNRDLKLLTSIWCTSLSLLKYAQRAIINHIHKYNRHHILCMVKCVCNDLQRRPYWCTELMMCCKVTNIQTFKFVYYLEHFFKFYWIVYQFDCLLNDHSV